MVGFSSFTFPESPIRVEQQNVQVFLDKKDFGAGTLYISERTISWRKGEDLGFTLAYTHTTLHAVCKDPLVCDKECIYMMVDGHVTMPGSPRVIDDQDLEVSSEDSEEPDVSEILLVPENSESVPVLYEVISQCQALNPDPDDMSDEDDENDEDNVYQDAEDDGTRDIGGGGDTEMDTIAHRLSHNTLQINYEYNNGSQHIDDEQFEDAD